MTEIDNAYTADRAFSDLLSTSDEHPITWNQVADVFKDLTRDELAVYMRRLHTELRDRQATARHNWTRYTTQFEETNALQVLRTRDQRQVELSLSDPNEVGFELDNREIWYPWWEAIVTAGIRAGHASDVHRLCENVTEFGDIPRTAWDEVSREWRTEDGTYPASVSQTRAVSMAWERYERRAHPRLHPADARLQKGWEAIWLTAKRSDFCNVWDDMARAMGIPQPELPTRSGTVTVSGTFNVAVPVSGVAIGDDPVEAFDMDDLMEALSTYDL